eukprot:CAMPEP_0204191720 /NCGR_PEP_ID=MMETSP0361-20130328/60303_1 /ASSEMBLY_ACC=CAM_ASM_000343 /TAXON_ID=268821 /ORGANISM="Scrippsiella Hangoei, Strain SHTV-5" /LENGTH=42 /DNA_ID= /DNA_START= /DNA_END= /DNA_ORIENTATION=
MDAAVAAVGRGRRVRHEAGRYAILNRRHKVGTTQQLCPQRKR